MHDHNQASIWMIDFAKTVVLPDNVQIDHQSIWSVGNHEDGYLIGINNLISIFEEITANREAAAKSIDLDSTESTLSDSANFISTCGSLAEQDSLVVNPMSALDDDQATRNRLKVRASESSSYASDDQINQSTDLIESLSLSKS